MTYGEYHPAPHQYLQQNLTSFPNQMRKTFFLWMSTLSSKSSNRLQKDHLPVNDFVITNLVDLFVLNHHFLLSSFHWNIWLEQSSQIWKDLFLLNLRNSTIPKVFISEIVNFPSFHIQTFHISCTQPHFTPALSDTLFTLNHTTSRWSGPLSETF